MSFWSWLGGTGLVPFGIGWLIGRSGERDKQKRADEARRREGSRAARDAVREYVRRVNQKEGHR